MGLFIVSRNAARAAETQRVHQEAELEFEGWQADASAVPNTGRHRLHLQKGRRHCGMFPASLTKSCCLSDPDCQCSSQLEEDDKIRILELYHGITWTVRITQVISFWYISMAGCMKRFCHRNRLIIVQQFAGIWMSAILSMILSIQETQV